MVKNCLLIMAFFSFGLYASINESHQQKPPKQFVVVLDAGHGGHDPGTSGNGYKEKSIALNIVLKAGAILEKTADIKVVYTRKDDRFIDLIERGAIANKAQADLFVSVHCNANRSAVPFGTETYVLGLHANKQNFEVAKKENSVIYLEEDYQEKYAQYDINSPTSIMSMTVLQEENLEQSVQVAKLVQDNFRTQLKRKDRKVKQAGFVVLHQTFMPSVLIETGFLSNKIEGAYLSSKKGQNELAGAIAKAIVRYKEGVASSLDDAPVPSFPVAEKPVPQKVPESTEKKLPIDPELKAPTKVAVKKEEVKKEPIRKQIEPIGKESVAISNEKVVFRVQIMATVKNIFLNPENFNGLDILTKEPYKNLYRYMYGNATSYSYAKELKARADAAGYTTSYIVVYKEGLRVPLTNSIINKHYN